ncbi:MAG: Fic family protein, partial [Nocardia sp.]|nr:Fic family protein [Nocardia sp.]
EQVSEFVSAEAFDERLATALHDVAMSGRVRRSRYEQSEGLSVQQAQRDLRELVRKQILEPVGRTRARFYVAGSRFPEAISELARTPTTLTDPYAV